MLHAIANNWPLINVVLGVFTTWVCWSLRQMAKNAIEKAVEKLTARLDGHSGLITGHQNRLNSTAQRLGEVEKDIADLPTKTDIARLEGAVKAVDREVSAVAGGVSRIENLFLKRGVDA